MNNPSNMIEQGTVTFKVEKMYILPEAGNLKAFCEVSINEAVLIKGVRVLNGKKGLFVSMPQEQGKDGKWYDQVLCTNESAFEDLTKAVLSHYEEITRR